MLRAGPLACSIIAPLSVFVTSLARSRAARGDKSDAPAPCKSVAQTVARHAQRRTRAALRAHWRRARRDARAQRQAHQPTSPRSLPGSGQLLQPGSALQQNFQGYPVRRCTTIPFATTRDAFTMVGDVSATTFPEVVGFQIRGEKRSQQSRRSAAAGWLCGPAFGARARRKGCAPAAPVPALLVRSGTGTVERRDARGRVARRADRRSRRVVGPGRSTWHERCYKKRTTSRVPSRVLRLRTSSSFVVIAAAATATRAATAATTTTATRTTAGACATLG